MAGMLRSRQKWGASQTIPFYRCHRDNSTQQCPICPPGRGADSLRQVNLGWWWREVRESQH